MDPLTHALIGAAVSYTLCGRTLGRHAAGLGALAGITPDIDHFVSSESDALIYVEVHRSFTHSVFFSLIGALLPLLPWLLRRDFRARLGALWLCALPAYLSHCLLDASTTWGTQLFWPFSRARISWDWVAIIDPVFTLAVAGLLVVALLGRSRRVAGLALGFAVAYLGFGAVQHARAVRVQHALAAARQHAIERSEVMPTLANNVVWRSVYLAGGKIHSDRIRVGWFSPGLAREGSALPLVTVESLRETEREVNRERRGFDRFVWFSGGWVARAPEDDTIIGDMRYSRSTEAFDPVWGIRLTKAGGRPTVEWVSRERNRRLSLADLWREISGGDARFKTAGGP